MDALVRVLRVLLGMVRPNRCHGRRLDRLAQGQRGFLLLEALVAVTLAATVALIAAHLGVVSARAAVRASQQSTSAALGGAKLEQLQSLPWWFVETPGGTLEPRSDTTTHLACNPFCAGGRGLSEGPVDTLVRSVDGYAEYLDRSGRSLGLPPAVPADARFVRRWGIWAAPQDPMSSLVLAVRVTPVDSDLADEVRDHLTVLPGETWVVTLRSRTRP